jgi:DNA repair photolyase
LEERLSIISASRRTDIPAFYSDWFFERIQEGFVLVRNPMNLHQVSRISLKREVVDCIVFWTKNPENILPKLSLIKDYQYYFQFTLNPYDAVIETDVPRKTTVIDTFKRLSDMIGPERVIWRYDPIILNAAIDAGYHEKYFEALAKKLHEHTSKCIISFVDNYKKTDKVFRAHGIYEVDDEKKRTIAGKISEIAGKYNLKVETCAEDIDLIDMGIGHARCIDPVLIESLLGVRINSEKDRNQRKPCGCIASTDIGAYNTCTHGCLYCYANYSKESVKKNIANYDIHSPLLCSKLTEADRVVEKEAESCILLQKTLF